MGTKTLMHDNFKFILDYELGKIPPGEIVGMFKALIETGDIWRLPTYYLDEATRIIEGGWLVADNPNRGNFN